MTTSYANMGGTGKRTGFITATYSGITGGCGSNYAVPLLDGSRASGNCTNGTAWGNANTASVLLFDFGVGTPMVIDEFTWWQSDASSHGTWTWAGSNDGSGYTNLLTGLTLGGATSQVYAYSNTTAYRYYKLFQTGGTTSASPWLEEIEFKIAPGPGVADYDATYGRGNRASIITGTYTGISGGCGSNYAQPLVDGSFTTGCSTANAWNASNTAAVLKFDLGAGNSAIFSEFLWYQDAAATHGTWMMAGSPDDVTYTALAAAAFTLGTDSYGQQKVVLSNAVAYRYYKLYQVGGTTSSGSWNEEIEFRVGASPGLAGFPYSQGRVIS